MEREQIIKGLECCVHIRVGQYCGSCPYNHMLGCRIIMKKDALALIRELTEENKRLRTEVAREQSDGEWFIAGMFDDFLKCSVCGSQHPWQTAIEYKYCPNCGARMKGGE